MIGQQMITEARQRTRYGQQPLSSHPRSRAQHRRTSPSLIYSLLRPLQVMGEKLRRRLRLPD